MAERLKQLTHLGNLLYLYLYVGVRTPSKARGSIRERTRFPHFLWGSLKDDQAISAWNHLFLIEFNLDLFTTQI